MFQVSDFVYVFTPLNLETEIGLYNYVSCRWCDDTVSSISVFLIYFFIILMSELFVNTSNEWNGPKKDFSALACFKYQRLWLGVSIKEMLVAAKSLSTAWLVQY